MQPRIGRSEENSAARAQESQSSSLRANAGDGQGVGSIATIATISEANPTFIRRAIRICNMVDRYPRRPVWQVAADNWLTSINSVLSAVTKYSSHLSSQACKHNLKGSSHAPAMVSSCSPPGYALCVQAAQAESFKRACTSVPPFMAFAASAGNQSRSARHKVQKSRLTSTCAAFEALNSSGARLEVFVDPTNGEIVGKA